MKLVTIGGMFAIETHGICDLDLLREYAKENKKKLQEGPPFVPDAAISMMKELGTKDSDFVLCYGGTDDLPVKKERPDGFRERQRLVVYLARGKNNELVWSKKRPCEVTGKSYWPVVDINGEK